MYQGFPKTKVIFFPFQGTNTSNLYKLSPQHIHMERIRYSSIRDFHRKYFQNFYYRQLHELCQSCYYNWIEIDDLVIDLILGSTFRKSISQTFPKKTLHKPFPPKTYSLCQNSSQCLFLL